MKPLLLSIICITVLLYSGCTHIYRLKEIFKVNVTAESNLVIICQEILPLNFLF